MKKTLAAAATILTALAFSAQAHATEVGAEATPSCTQLVVVVTNNYDRVLTLEGYGAFASQPQGRIAAHGTATWRTALTGATTSWGFNLIDPVTGAQVNSTGDRTTAVPAECAEPTTTTLAPQAPPPIATTTTTTAEPTLGDVTGSIAPRPTTTAVMITGEPSFTPAPRRPPATDVEQAEAAGQRLASTGAETSIAWWAGSFCAIGVLLCIAGVVGPRPRFRRRH